MLLLWRIKIIKKLNMNMSINVFINFGESEKSDNNENELSSIEDRLSIINRTVNNINNIDKNI